MEISIYMYFLYILSYLIYIMDQFNKPVASSDDPTLGVDDPRGIDLRDRAIAKSDPLGGVFGVGKSAMDVAEMFGIDKKTIGTMLLKSILSGKLELPGVKNEVNKRKKIEVMVDQIIKLILTCFGIFMGYKIFELVVMVVI